MYINIKGANSLANRRSSIAIRKDYPSYHDLMITKKGNRLKLLGRSVKTDKRKKINGEDVGITVSVLYLSPNIKAGYGINTCPWAGSCVVSCLTYSGRLGIHHPNQALKTQALYAYPKRFLQQIINEIEIESVRARQAGDILYVRLNGTSDIKWESLLCFEKMVQDFNGLGGFYDYTKAPAKARSLSDNYHLTYSIDEQNVSLSRAMDYRAIGQPIAVVGSKKDVAELLSKDIGLIDGDNNDMRFFDSGVVLLSQKNLIKGSYPNNGLVQSKENILSLLNTTIN